jgi:hypothetical protein
MGEAQTGGQLHPEKPIGPTAPPDDPNGWHAATHQYSAGQ